MKKISFNTKALVAALAVAFAFYGQASAQTLLSSTTSGIATTSTIPITVAGATDYAIYSSTNAAETQQIALEGTPDSFTNAVLANTVNPVGTNGGGNEDVLLPDAGAYTFTGYNGTATTNASAQDREPLGGQAEFNIEASTLTFSQTLLAANEELNLYSNGFSVNQTFTATLYAANGTTVLAATTVTDPGVYSTNLAAQSLFIVNGAAAGDILTFVETVTLPTGARFYPQAYVDGITVLASATPFAAPEPSTYALMGFGLVALLATLKFRKLNA
jgi:hypothetical protein